MRLLDQGAAADQHRSDRRAQPLGKTDRNRIERLAQLLHRHAAGHGRIEDARAVQMGGQAMLAGPARGLRDIAGGHDPALEGVFQRQQPGTGEMRIAARLERGRQPVQRQAAVGGMVDGLRLDAAQHRSAASLEFVRMGLLPHQILVAAGAMRHQRGQVALRARREEQPGLLARPRGNLVLQAPYAGVIAHHIVTHRRGRHGLPHGGAGTGHGIAAQIDHGCST
ncbi:Uncharacterised protein [Bordetella pertussis]|nr:Uncharacterised protein [Bordetella pertussis]